MFHDTVLVDVCVLLYWLRLGLRVSSVFWAAVGSVEGVESEVVSQIFPFCMVL